MTDGISTANSGNIARSIAYVPKPSDLLANAEFKARFEESSAALEAAYLVREMRQRASSVDGSTGISQAELARRTGLSQPRISQIEKGTGRDGISYTVIRKVAHACGFDWSGLIHEILDQKSPMQTLLKEETEFARTLQTLAEGMEKAAKGLEENQKRIEQFSHLGLLGNEPMMSFGKANFESFLQVSQILASGLQELSERISESGRTNVEESVTFTKKLIGAQSFKEAIELQLSFTRDSFEKMFAPMFKTLLDTSERLNLDVVWPNVEEKDSDQNLAQRRIRKT